MTVQGVRSRADSCAAWSKLTTQFIAEKDALKITSLICEALQHIQDSITSVGSFMRC
jgi:hypothetical protein